MATPLLERFNEKYIPEPNTGCWIWLGSLNFGGYGDISNGRKNKHIGAHRVGYQLFKGEIPAGLDLDHKCRVRCCVNPDHLEPVTRSENVKRGLMPSINRARAAAQTHCQSGHTYVAENVGSYRARGGTVRYCKVCKNIQKRAAYHLAKRAS